MAIDKNPAPEITEQNTRLDPETNTYQFSDEAMIKLILDDTESGDAWMNQAQWAGQWTASDMLYQSPSSSFDGIAGMSVPKFTVSNTCSAVVPKVMGALFYDPDAPFQLRQRPKANQDVVMGKKALFSYQLDDMDFEEEVEAGWEQNSLLGTQIYKWGWTSYKKVTMTYKAKSNRVAVNTPLKIDHIDTPDSDDFEAVPETTEIHRPWIKWCDLRTVLVDRGCRRGDIRKAKEVVYRDYATWSDLDDLRGVEGYNIPPEDELKMFFLERATVHGDNAAMTLPEGMRGYLQHALPRNQKSTADPMENGLEILERWDKEKVGVLLRWNDHNILIRNEPNPYGKIPFLSSTWRNNPDAFHGQGLGQLIGTEQMVDQGTTTLALGMLAYGLQPTAVRKQGFNAISQPTVWELGGIINVEDDVDKSFKFLEFPKIPSEAFAMVQQSQATAAETSGANQQFTMGAGAPGIKTTGARSGTGAALVGQANASRLDGPVERFIRQVFVPWLYQMDELNNQRLPTRVLNQILGEKLGEEFKVDHIEFRNAKMEFDVLAGAHLGAVQKVVQFLPFVLNIVNNPTLMELAAEQGLGFNFKNWFSQFADLAGLRWAQNLFTPLTPQQAQTRQANSPAGVAQAKGQQSQQLQTDKFKQQQILNNEAQLGKAAGEASRIILEHALSQEEGAGLPEFEAA